MTGLWQVCGRHTVSFERRIELDLYCVEAWRLWPDLIILLKTPFAVINCKGAGQGRQALIVDKLQERA